MRKTKLDKLLKEIELVMSRFNKICIKCDNSFKGEGHFCKSCQRQKKLDLILNNRSS